MSSMKIPPDPSAAENYLQWKKDIKLWSKLTDVPLKKQGLALQFATQKDQHAHEIVCGLDSDLIEKDDGLDKVIIALDALYIKDKVESSYEAYEAFEVLRRKDSETINDFVQRFKTLLSRTEGFGTTMSTDLLAFRLLNAAKLSETQKQLVRASASEFTLDKIIASLKKIFGSAVINSDHFNVMPEHINIKTEPINHTSHIQNPYSLSIPESYNQNPTHVQPYMQASKYPPSPQELYEGHHREDTEQDNEVLYSRYNSRPSRFPIRRPAAGNRSAYTNTGYRGSNFRGNNNRNTRTPRNPTDHNGQVTRCSICDSTMHYIKDCPHREPAETYYEDTFYQIILFQNDLDQPETLPKLVHESLNAAILDCGASKTCCGRSWLHCFIESLTDEEREKVSYTPSKNNFKFGDGEVVTAFTSACIPVTIGSHNVMLQTDVVEKEIPLLLSKQSMKKCHAVLDTRTDTVTMFGENLNLINTSSGHYAIPITSKRDILNNIEENSRMNLVLMTNDQHPERRTIALKLHRQFAHPPPERLIKLINQSNLSTDELLKKEIFKVSESCEICLRYKKPPPRPCVGMPHATQFNQCVAMDLKFYHGTILLHLIDHCTRFSMSSIVKNKCASTIIEEIFKSWISIFGAPEKFMSDNGTEFANNQFREMSEAYNIRVNTSPAEAPYSNGLVERYNHVLSEMLDKIIYDTKCSLAVALPWAVNAKNSLQTIHGFSPAQLVFAYNPRLPSVFIDKPPALAEAKYSEIIEDNLKAMRRARTAFLQAESSERIRRALNKKVRTSCEANYITGDTIYFKRKDDRRWHGPAKVIGQDGRMILVRNQSTWIRVHPCRVIHADTAAQQLIKPESPEESSSISPCSVDEDDYNVPNNTDAQHPDPNSSNEHQTDDELEDDQDQAHELEEDQHQAQEDIEKDDVDNRDNNEATESNTRKTQTAPSKNMMKKGKIIEFRREGEDDTWLKAQIINRAGKANKMKYKNKYSNEWNVIIDGEEKCINFDNEIAEVRPYQEVAEEILYTADYQDQQIKEIEDAKAKELSMWIEQDVYEEVEDSNNKLISLKWVIKPKLIDGKQAYKARLVAKGFQDVSEVRKDSPTCAKDSIRFSLAVITTNKWHLKSIDVKCAFLQGEGIDRNIFVHPPKEARTNKIWKLKKTVYGLRDASRSWYIKIRDELKKLGCSISLDKGMFYWKPNQTLQGIICLFVDDILTAGTEKFFEEIIGKLKKVFTFGSSNEVAFTYVGISIIQNSDYSIDLNQQSYTKSLKPIDIPHHTNSNDQVPDHIQSEFRSLVGSLNWLSTVSRPDISFNVCQSSTRISNATYADVAEINKIIRYLSYHESTLKIPVFHSLAQLTLLAYTDAAYANLPGGYSQGAYIIFITDGDHSCPVSWSSHKLKRVVRSTLAAESLALLEGCDAAFYVASLISPIILNNAEISINVVTDCQSLATAAETSNIIEDKRLRVEMSAIRELVDNGSIKLHWSSTKMMLADRLTKTGASPRILLDALRGKVL